MIPLDKLGQVTILVTGDYILDQYCYGTTDRLSPEAPVPVLNVREEKNVPGGAANVVNNLCALGCKVLSFGMVGDDEAGAALTALLDQAGACTKHLYRARSYRTLIKKRIVGNNNYQIARLDYNESVSFPGIEHFPYKLKEVLSGCDIVVLSDYGKGFCSADTAKILVNACRGLGVPVVIDPKGTDWVKYRGATWITPNFSEFAAIVGKTIRNSDDDISAYIAEISETYDFDNVLVTRSEQGMTLFDGKDTTHVRAKVKDVFDVTGAGDTTVSVLSALLGAGCEKLAAVEIANLAAGIAITKSGTATVTRDEISSELRMQRLYRDCE